MRSTSLALLLFAVLAPNAHGGTPLPDTPHIVVAGSGEVHVAPDIARVQFGFSRGGATSAAAAKRDVDAGVNRLLDALQAFGLPPVDVEASDLEASPDIDYDDDGQPVDRGFRAGRRVTATLRDLERFNDILDTGLAAGATRIEDIAFESSRADALRAEAKAAAVEDAKREAREMARAFGAGLGPVYSINSVNSRFAQQYGGTELDRITVTGSRIDPGRYIQPSVSYGASVSAVFELER